MECKERETYPKSYFEAWQDILERFKNETNKESNNGNVCFEDIIDKLCEAKPYTLNGYENPSVDKQIKSIRKRIKYCKHPVEKQKLEKELHELRRRKNEENRKKISE